MALLKSVHVTLRFLGCGYACGNWWRPSAWQSMPCAHFPSSPPWPPFRFFVRIAWPLSAFWALPLTNAFSKTKSSSFHEDTEERLPTLGNSCRLLFLVSFNLLWELLSEELLPPEKESVFHGLMSTPCKLPRPPLCKSCGLMRLTSQSLPFPE